jgi:hypothetical protein
MTDTMTDPADELADSCSMLISSGKGRCETAFATKFGVPEWSKEFYQIIFCLVDRADYVGALLLSRPQSAGFAEKLPMQINGLNELLPVPWTPR